MKLIGYLRVSTDEQAERGYGLDVQEQQVRSWCRRNGHRLVRIERDEGTTGAIAERDGLDDALAALTSGEAVGIVFPRLDRLSRDMLVQEQILNKVWASGRDAFSTLPGEADLRDDPEDPTRKLIRRVLGAIAEYDREWIVLRMRRGRRRKAERGGFAYGSPPYGYRAVNRRLVPDRREQAALRRMRDLAATGASTREIAAALRAEGHPTKRGGSWSPPVVARILARHTPAPISRTVA